jgi:hypothetical protein
MKAWLEALTGRHGLDELFLGRSLIRELATRREATAADDAEGLETTRRRKARLGPEDEPDAEVRAFLYGDEHPLPRAAAPAAPRERHVAPGHGAHLGGGEPLRAAARVAPRRGGWRCGRPTAPPPGPGGGLPVALDSRGSALPPAPACTTFRAAAPTCPAASSIATAVSPAAARRSRAVAVRRERGT